MLAELVSWSNSPRQGQVSSWAGSLQFSRLVENFQTQHVKPQHH